MDLECDSGALNFLYRNTFGRICLKIVTLPVVSKLGGIFLGSALSKPLVNPFIKKHNINMYDYGRNHSFKSFNAFFTRRVRKETRPVDMRADSLIAVCDAKLTAYRIDENSVFHIKGSDYSVETLLKNRELSWDYINGYCLVFRLTVDDYHRYCYIDDGYKKDNTHIRGRLHTVQPVSMGEYDIYKENSREYTVMHTENFGQVTQVEVGALMVGKIKNHQRACRFRKGQEKGLFEFGGSTIVVLLQQGAAQIQEEILDNTANSLETVVKMGETIGYKGV